MTDTVNSSMTGASTDEIQRLMLAAREALTDNMVERLAETGGAALEIVDRLNDADTRAAVHAIFDRLTEFHQIGALDTLFETVLMLHAARSAATDSIVERLAAFVEQMANSFGSDDLAECAQDLVQALNSAARETAQHEAKGGMWATLAMLGKPETQQSLYFLLKMGEALRRSQEGR
jgi:uncharacterized protein YjgD (DUF1641 family)